MTKKQIDLLKSGDRIYKGLQIYQVCHFNNTGAIVKIFSALSGTLDKNERLIEFAELENMHILKKPEVGQKLKALKSITLYGIKKGKFYTIKSVEMPSYSNRKQELVEDTKVFNLEGYWLSLEEVSDPEQKFAQIFFKPAEK